jgi:superfamily II DNA or RNA helicase
MVANNGGVFYIKKFRNLPVNFSAHFELEGLKVHLPATLAEWVVNISDELLPLASQIISDCELASIPDSSVSFLLPNDLVAAWPEQVARLAKLPPAMPFPLDLRLSAGLGQSGTVISSRWMKVGLSVSLSAVPEIIGLEARFKGQSFRLTDPYWTILKYVEKFNQNKDNPSGQFECWGEIRTLLGENLTKGLTDSFLRSLRVVSADAFTLAFSPDASGSPDVIPRLMRKHPDPSGQCEHGGAANLTGELALLPDDENLFVSRLDALSDGQKIFPLREGTFIAVTPELSSQLSAVKKIRKASKEERRQMVLNPSGVLREMIAGAESDSFTLDFIETDKYSDRVTSLSKWVPPIVPWVKIPPVDWKGSAEPTGGFRIGDKEVTLTHDQVLQSIDKVRQAVASGADTVEIPGGTLVPATDATLKSLQHLRKALADPNPREPKSGLSNATDNLVLVIETNFENDDFCRTQVAPRPGRLGMPYCLSTQPKPHQETGIRWLQEHWIKGSTGCLLADDMGLGKTYQALAFLAWLKEQMNDGVIPPKPLLVVAPVGLLANWEKEQGLHLRHAGIGEPLRAYGSWLKLLKRGSHMGGDATLDTVQMSRAPWILANYEAISDYQLSFGAIQFGAVIFDEAQKIKSPSTAMTSAAKALNSDFVVAMTGTPVENRLADLWCIADTCQPFALKDLKSFSRRFETNPAPETLKALRDNLWQQESDVGVSEPLMLLRRLKTEKLKGLPEKKEHTVRQNMPMRQLQAYRQAISLNDIRGPQGTLGLIQSLRQISLHPGLFDGQGFDPMDSARFAATLEILDKVSKDGEKVLIFIESLEIQAANQLPLLLQRRYRLKELPMVINGSIGTKERQKRVDAFQESSEGFDVMLLSPKAGGVGLTLTAANHVIHLSRWWNPAVEDQCSDRAHRIGQTKDVHIYYPVAIYPEDPERSFDLKLNELMSRKRELSKSMLMPMEFGPDDYDALINLVSKT